MADIEIHKNPNGDSRSNPNPTIQECTRATKSHINDVIKGMTWIANKLIEVGKIHDNTKTSKMKEFHEALISGKIKNSDWYEEHITKERHHLISKCPDDVNLIDVIECIVDCTMAGLTRSGEIYDVELDPRILEKAVANTVELLKKNTKVLTEAADLLDEKINE